MAADVGVRVKVEGEKTFTQAIRTINQQMKELDAEMKAAVSSMDGMQKGETQTAQKTRILTESIAKAQEKVSLLSQQYDKAKSNLTSLGTAQEEAKSKLDAYGNELTEAKAKLDTLGTELEQLKNAEGDHSTEIQEVTQAYEAQKAVVDQAQQNYINQNKEVTKATNAYNKEEAEVARLGTQINTTNATINKHRAELEKTTSSLYKAGEAAKKWGERLSTLGNTMSKIGGFTTKYITTPVLAAGTASVKFASDYNENLNKVDASFKDSADVVKEWAKTATESFGLSENAALEATSLFGDMGTSMGLTTEQAAEMAISLTGLAGDLSSFKNIGISEAMTALKGVFTGETESIKELGVVMTETNLKEFADGLGLVYDEMSQTEKVTLRYQYVLDKTENSQGDYIRTSDEAANSLRTMKAEAENLAVAFGEEILPTITPLIQSATELIQKFGELDEETKQFIIKALAISAAAGPVTKGLSAVSSAAGTVATYGGKLMTAVAGSGSALAGLAGPVGIASVALFGITVALANAIANTEESKTETQLLGEASAETQTQLQGLNDEIKKSPDGFRASTSAAESNAEANANLISSLISATDAYDGTATSALDIQNIVDQLNTSIPDLNLAFDAETGTLNMTGEALEALNEKYEAQTKYDAAVENRNNLLEQQKSAQEALTSAQGTYTEALENLNQFEKEHTHVINGVRYANSGYEFSWSAARDAVDDAADAVSEAEKTVDSAGNAVGDAEKDVDAYGKQLDEAAKKSDKFAKKTTESEDALEEEAQAAKEATQSLAKVGLAAYDAVSAGGDLRAAYEELSSQAEQYTDKADAQIVADTEAALAKLNHAATVQELGNKYGEMSDLIGVSTDQVADYLIAADMSFDDFAASVEEATTSVVNDFQETETSLGLSLEEMGTNLYNNIQAQAEWNDNIALLWNKAVESGNSGAMDLVKALYDMGIQGGEQVAQFVNLTDEQLEWWANLYGKAGGEAAEKATIGSAMASDQLYESGMEMKNEQLEGYESVDMEPSGSESVERTIDGMKSQTSAVRIAAQQQTDAITTIWTNAAPSFQSIGLSATQSIAGGLSSGQPYVTSAANLLAQAAKDSAGSISFYSVGYNMAQGIANGLYGGSSLIKSAAISVARSALSSAKSELGINSPSRVFRDEVGEMMGEGMVLGLEDSMRRIEQAARLVSNNAYGAVARNMALSNAGSNMTNRQYTVSPTIYVYGAPGQDENVLAEKIMAKINTSLIRRSMS